MSPGRPDPFKAEVGVSYTKGEVNRAGRLLRRYLEAGVVSDFDEALATIGIEEVAGAFRALTWWRSLHARPSRWSPRACVLTWTRSTAGSMDTSM